MRGVIFANCSKTNQTSTLLARVQMAFRGFNKFRNYRRTSSLWIFKCRVSMGSE